MADDLVTRADLVNVKIDIRDIGLVANSDEVTDIVMRLGLTVPTLAKQMAAIAVQEETATASALVAGQFATYPEDEEIPGYSGEYSALHYAAKAETAQSAAADFAYDAGNSAIVAGNAAEDAVAPYTESLLNCRPLKEIVLWNDAMLTAQVGAFTLTDLTEAYTFGDSLTEGAQIVDATYRWPAQVQTYTPGATITNQGIGGQTSAQVLARWEALSGSDKAKLAFYWAGANDYGITLADDQSGTVEANYTTFTADKYDGFIVMGGWDNNNITLGGGAQAIKVAEWVAETYGGDGLNIYDILIQYYAGDETARNLVLKGGLPDQILVDSIHPNQAGATIIAPTMARLMRAKKGGAPYIHMDQVGIEDGVAEDVEIHTPRICGDYGGGAEIVGGNNDDILKIDPVTAVITKGAGDLTADFREVEIRVKNLMGSHSSRILYGRAHSGFAPTAGVEIIGNGAAAMARPSALTGIANSKKLSVFFLAKILDDTIVTGDFLLGATGLVARTTNGKFRTTVRNPGGTILCNADSPTNAVRDQWCAYFLCIDTGAAQCHFGVNEQTPTTDVTVTDDVINLSPICGMFSNVGGSAFLAGIGIKNFWMTLDYVDFTSPVERAKFYNPSTREGLDLGSDGEVSGYVAPIIYNLGTPHDWSNGRNLGSGGRFWSPRIIDRDNAGFRSVD